MALRYYFQIFTKSYWVVFEKRSLYFTSPVKISKSKCNSEIPPKKHLILIQAKIPFECTKSLALGCYSQDFTKNYRVGFWENLLYFPSYMKISKSKSNNKTVKNTFNFDSKNSFWVHMDTGIRMLFIKFYKKLSSRFWKIVTLLHLPSPLWKFLSPTKCNRKPPQNPFNFDSIKNSFWLHVVNGIYKLLTKFKTVTEYFWEKVENHKKKKKNNIPKDEVVPIAAVPLKHHTKKKNPFNFDSIKNSFGGT